MAPPVVAATEAVRAAAEPAGRLIMLSPQGRRLDQRTVAELALEPRLILLCGRYEGFDERIIEILEPELLSVGDYHPFRRRSRRDGLDRRGRAADPRRARG